MWSGVVQDVPPGLEACEACREIGCTKQRWQTCVQRLATEALIMEGLDALSTPVSRTDEMQGYGSNSGAVVEETPIEESRPRRRRLSPC
jgi:hypothetical protein